MVAVAVMVVVVQIVVVGSPTAKWVSSFHGEQLLGVMLRCWGVGEARFGTCCATVQGLCIEFLAFLLYILKSCRLCGTGYELDTIHVHRVRRVKWTFAGTFFNMLSTLLLILSLFLRKILFRKR